MTDPFADFQEAMASYCESLAALTHASDVRERNEMAKRVGEDLYRVLNTYSLVFAQKLAAQRRHEWGA